MGQAAENKQYYTVEEYFELEEHSEIRHEFFKNEIFAMAGTSTKHNRIVRNTGNALDSTFAERGCGIFTESVKVELEKDGYYVYPDVVLTCNSKDLDADFILKHPCLLVEVGSKSTESYDRSMKWQHYQKIPSLQYYLLVSQEYVYVDVYARQSNGFEWSYRSYNDLEATIELKELNASISLNNIYKNIVFPPTKPHEFLSPR